MKTFKDTGFALWNPHDGYTTRAPVRRSDDIDLRLEANRAGVATIMRQKLLAGIGRLLAHDSMIFAAAFSMVPDHADICDALSILSGDWEVVPQVCIIATASAKFPVGIITVSCQVIQISYEWELVMNVVVDQ